MFQTISVEDLYNYLYWDHRIYDVRSVTHYNAGHICRSHHMDPSKILSIDEITEIDQQINQDYGRAENPDRVIVYNHSNNDNESNAVNQLIVYLTSTKNPSNQQLKYIHLLNGGYEQFQQTFPFLCSSHPHYQECIKISWPSWIVSDLFLGSSICRSNTIIEMLNITHVLSLSDYPENDCLHKHIKTSHWQVADSLSANLRSIFPLAIAWMSKAIDEEHGRILIHCDQGVSRSPSIVIAYLLKKYHDQYPTVQTALDYVKSKRNIIRPNATFLRQLEDFASTVLNDCTQ